MTRLNRQPARPAVLALRRAQSIVPVLFLLLALAVLAAGCGATADDDRTELRSPDAVHEAWVAAIREGDGDAALALVDPELSEREPFAG
ncbi:hypothetical protein SD80_027625 [Scytonema tolypothrichoides VB-61278]|nr:hypothetical protein SD80_027625 [Scytonema tolypothrichoides VB-61278]